MSSDSKDGLVACACTLMSLSVVSVGLRLYARRQQKIQYLADDWIIVVALLGYIASTIIIIIATQNKVLGYSVTDIPPQDAEASSELSSKLQIVLHVFQTISGACVKLSVLYFYRRIFCMGSMNRWFNYLTAVTIVLVLIWLVVFEFLTGFQCGTHFSALWNGTYVQYCKISFPFLYGLTISDFLFDVWILSLPISLVLRLNISPLKKLSVFGIFLLGFIGLAASIARMVVLIKDELGGPSYFITHDPERTDSTYIFFMMMENGISLVAANLPSLWLLCTLVIPEQIARSIRSMVSLFSVDSNRFGSRSTDWTTENATQISQEKKFSETSSGSGNYSVSSHSLQQDIEGPDRREHGRQQAGDAATMSKKAIHVQHTVELRHE